MRKRTITLALSSLLLASSFAFAADVTQDGGFETGVPNSFWNESSTNFGTVLCTVALCGTGTGTGPHSGSWWLWFGGISALEVGHAYQDMVIAPGTATLTFWLESAASSGDSADFMAVSIDNTELFRLTGDATAPYATYKQVVIDVSAFADGGMHTLKFDSTITGSLGQGTNFFVDDVSLDVEDPTTCASEGYKGAQLTWCKNICENGLSGQVLDTWIHRWINRYRDLPYCAVEGGDEGGESGEGPV